MSEKLTIEQNLSLLLETKTKMKENIIASGGTINDDTPFIEYVKYVGGSSEGGASGYAIEVSTHEEMDALLVEANLNKLYKYVGESDDTYVNGQYYIIVESDTVIPSGVGATLYQEGGYEPIPIGVVVDKIIFNLDLSVSEVQNILSNLVLPSDFPAYMIFSNTTNAIHLMVINYGAMMGSSQKMFVVTGQLGDNEIPVWSDPSFANEMGFSGWNTEAFTQLGGNELTIGVASDSTYDADGIILQVGTQNDVISQIFNIGEKASIKKELKGDYDGVSVKATSNGNLDLLPYIDNKQIPTQVKVNVPQPKPNLQEKLVTPSTSSQTITFDDGYDGLKEVTISGVTSSIDSDIVASNIKSGVNILGVTGTYEGELHYTNRLTSDVGSVLSGIKILKSVNIPYVTKISDFAFSDCINLENLNGLDKQLTNINGAFVFQNCKLLTSFEFGENITNDTTYGLEKWFVNCISLTNVVLPKIITYIGSMVFNGCISLPKIDIPENIEYISVGAFVGCSSLQTVIIRNSTKMVTLKDFSNDNTAPFYSTPLGNGTGNLYVPDSLVASYKADASWQVQLPNYNTQIKPLSEYVE